MVDYRYRGISQYVRLSDGQVAVGPLRESVAVVRLSRDFGRTPSYVRNGSGPKELTGTFFVLAAGASKSILTASPAMARAKWAAADGTLLRTTPMPAIVR